MDARPRAGDESAPLPLTPEGLVRWAKSRRRPTGPSGPSG